MDAYNCDVYATFAKLTGSKIPENQALDSLDFSGILFGEASSPRTKYVYFHHVPMAYRSGNFKIHFETRERTRNPATGKYEPNMKHKKPLLFDLKNDPGEKNNIAASNPEIVVRLTKEYKEALKALMSPNHKFQ